MATNINNLVTFDSFLSLSKRMRAMENSGELLPGILYGCKILKKLH